MSGNDRQSPGADPVVRTRLVRRDDLTDRSFDLQFWADVGAEGRFAATWDLVLEWRRMRGEAGAEPGLQRCVCRLERR